MLEKTHNRRCRGGQDFLYPQIVLSEGKLMGQLMSFSRPMQWYRSHADLIWPDGPFKDKFPEDSEEAPFCGYKKEDMSRTAPESSLNRM
jgi:hypothetical protein